MNDPALNFRGTSGSRFRFLAMAAFVMMPVLGSCAGDLDPGLQAEYCKTHDCKGGTSSGTGGMMGGGTGGSSTGSGGGSVASCDAYTMVFKDKCAICHVDKGLQPFPDLSSAAQALNAIGATQSTAGKCKDTSKGTISVNSALPLSGTFFDWITGSACGDRMPLGGSPLSQSEIDCVKAFYTAAITK